MSGPGICESCPQARHGIKLAGELESVRPHCGHVSALSWPIPVKGGRADKAELPRIMARLPRMTQVNAKHRAEEDAQ